MGRQVLTFCVKCYSKMRLQVGKIVGRTEAGELGRLAKIFPKSEKSSQNFENLPKIISISGKGVWRKWEAKLKVLGRFWFYFGKNLLADV